MRISRKSDEIWNLGNKKFSTIILTYFDPLALKIVNFGQNKSSRAGELA
jgi:hypothetical protein